MSSIKNIIKILDTCDDSSFHMLSNYLHALTLNLIWENGSSDFTDFLSDMVQVGLYTEHNICSTILLEEMPDSLDQYGAL